MYRRLIAMLVLAVTMQLVAVRADDQQKKAQSVGSAPVSLGNGDYTLIARDTGKLVLQLTVNNRVREWDVIPTVDSNRNDEWPAQGNAKRISQIALTRWSRDSMFAVVKVAGDRDAAFWCLTFKHLPTVTNGMTQLNSPAVIVAKGTKSDRILAVSGSIESPAIAIVTGTVSEKDGTISQGTIVYEWCGFPEYAKAGTFKPAYPN